MNAQTRILLECMRPMIDDVEPDWWSPWEEFTEHDAERFWHDLLHDYPEAYDEPWFPIIAVRAAELQVCYEELAEFWTTTWWAQCWVLAEQGLMPPPPSPYTQLLLDGDGDPSALDLGEEA